MQPLKSVSCNGSPILDVDLSRAHSNNEGDQKCMQCEMPSYFRSCFIHEQNLVMKGGYSHVFFLCTM